jgi:hypothetical protein
MVKDEDIIMNYEWEGICGNKYSYAMEVMPILSEGKKESRNNGQCLGFLVINRKHLHLFANQMPSQSPNILYQFFKHESRASSPFCDFPHVISDSKKDSPL